MQPGGCEKCGLELNRAGRAALVDEAAIHAAVDSALATGAVRSNDAHVLGLARASGARCLCTSDDTLIADFKDKLIVDKPRGRVYQVACHAQLLRHDASCSRVRGLVVSRRPRTRTRSR